MQSGYTIDLSASTALTTPGDITISEAIPPTLCNNSQINLYMSQALLCGSVSASDFALYDLTNQQVAISSIEKPECTNGLDYTAAIMVNLAQPLVPGNQYRIVRTGDLAGACGAHTTGTSELVFTAEPIAIDSFFIEQQYCYGAYLTPVTNLPFDVANIVWDTPTGNEYTHYPLHINDDGLYTISLTSSTGCQISYSEYIDVLIPDPAPLTITISGDTIFCSPAIYEHYDWDIYIEGNHYSDSTSVNYIVIPGLPESFTASVYIKGTTDSGCAQTNYYNIVTSVTEDLLNSSITCNTMVTDKLVINSQTPLSGTFNIYNLSGMLMQSTRVDNTGSIQLDMSGYAEGLYILNFTNSQGQSYSTKLDKIAD